MGGRYEAEGGHTVFKPLIKNEPLRVELRNYVILPKIYQGTVLYVRKLCF